MSKRCIYVAILRRTCVSPCSCTSLYTPVGEAAFSWSCSYLRRLTFAVDGQYGVALRVSLGHVRLCTLPAEMLALLVLLVSPSFNFRGRWAIRRRTCVSPCSCTSLYTSVGEAAFSWSCSYLRRLIFAMGAIRRRTPCPARICAVYKQQRLSATVILNVVKNLFGYKSFLENFDLRFFDFTSFRSK